MDELKLPRVNQSEFYRELMDRGSELDSALMGAIISMARKHSWYKPEIKPSKPKKDRSIIKAKRKQRNAK